MNVLNQLFNGRLSNLILAQRPPLTSDNTAVTNCATRTRLFKIDKDKIMNQTKNNDGSSHSLGITQMLNRRNTKHNKVRVFCTFLRMKKTL